MSFQSPADGAAEQALGEIEAAVQQGEIARATHLADAALAAGLEHPLVLNLVASRLEDEGRLSEAFEQLKRALELAPADLMIITAIGMNLDKQGRRPEALRAFDAAVAIDPGFPQAHHQRGQTLQSLGDFDGAKAAYEQAAALSPIYADPLGGLATLAGRHGDGAGARAFAEQALRIDPDHAVSLAALAGAELEEGQVEPAERRLRALLASPALPLADRPAVEGMLGDALDEQGRVPEAFAAYSSAKALAERLHARQFGPEAGPTDLDRAQAMAAAIEAADPAPWRTLDLSDPGDAAAHVFLLGFPRSGTTLLEQVLASHPDVATLEELAATVDGEAEFLCGGDGLERLARLEGEPLKLYRDAYWGRIAKFGLRVQGRTFVDKFPLASMKLPLIAKLFPHARILFAVRDPRDVVLSCFRRGFGMNASMYQFTSLERAARFYDAVMRLADVCRARLPLNVHEVRYETLVEDFEPTARAAAQFIGLEWSESMRDFAAAARARPIRTPSASQVRRGLYADALQQWRRYEAQLRPILPILDPWVERWGYEPG